MPVRLSERSVVIAIVSYGTRRASMNKIAAARTPDGREMPTSNPYYRGPASDHFDGVRFFNPGEPGTDRRLRDLLRWRRTAPDNPWPKNVPVRPTKPDVRVDGLRVTMVGHATLLIQVAGLNILTDPVWSDRASPVGFAGPKRAAAPGIALGDLPPIDAILLSHNHYDHLDIATLRTLQAGHAPLIVTPLGNDAIVRRRLPAARIEARDWGGHVSIAPRAEVHVVPANHWSSRGLRDRRMALWGGFMLRAATKLVYFAGDTGYGTGSIFRRMRAAFGSPDLALLPIGAYDPRWFMAAQHVDPDEAVQILCDLDARAALGTHWGVFKLTDEARDDPAKRLSSALRARGIHESRFDAMSPGDVRQYS